MKIAFAAALAAALFAIGCGTETTTTTTTTTADTAVTTDTAGDTATGTDSTGADTTATDTAKADTTKTDTGKDTVVAPKKCAPTNNACLQTCGMASCGQQNQACQADAKCSGLNACLNACPTDVPAPASPTDLPADPTAPNCFKTCLDTAGQPATDKFYATQNCLTENCFVCEAGDQQCQGYCATGSCLESMFACQANKACLDLLGCVGECKDQTCFQACSGKFPEGNADFNVFLTCYQQNMTMCDE